MIASKAKCETVTHNSVPLFFCELYFSLYEKMKKCFFCHENIKLTLILATETLLNKKIKQIIVSYKMNYFSVHYHRKIEQKPFTAN